MLKNVSRSANKQGLEEDRLSQAWIALWGRQNLFGAAKVSVGAGQDLEQHLEEQQAVEMAARRIAFLEIYPEHLCAEQKPLLKAFARRHWAVTERVRADVLLQRAAAWEAMHSPSRASLDSAEQGSCKHQGDPPCSDGIDHNGSAADVGVSCCFSPSFMRGHAAYIAYSERRSTERQSVERQSVADNVRRRLFKLADGKRRWSFMLAGGKRGDGDVSVSSVEQRAKDSLASAWESHNRSRIGAVRFADTHHAEKGGASVAAVLALAIVPVLVNRNLMCNCKVSNYLNGVAGVSY